jgi:hypothetical protein
MFDSGVQSNNQFDGMTIGAHLIPMNQEVVAAAAAAAAAAAESVDHPVAIDSRHGDAMLEEENDEGETADEALDLLERYDK